MSQAAVEVDGLYPKPIEVTDNVVDGGAAVVAPGQIIISSTNPADSTYQASEASEYQPFGAGSVTSGVLYKKQLPPRVTGEQLL